MARGKETILLVEDEEMVKRLAVDLLKMAGYTVLEASGGGDALLHCERYSGPIHLMITDVVMPQMSGRELAERVAPLRPEMKVLYMSGYTDNAIHHGILEKATFIQKPFTHKNLLSKVRNVLDQREHI
jgi:DNA-binding NtrC family response regulator